MWNKTALLNFLDLDILELDIFGGERERERGHFEKSDCEESGSSRLGSVRNLGIPDLGDVMEIVRNIILSNLRVLHLNE